MLGFLFTDMYAIYPGGKKPFPMKFRTVARSLQSYIIDKQIHYLAVTLRLIINQLFKRKQTQANKSQEHLTSFANTGGDWEGRWHQTNILQYVAQLSDHLRLSRLE